MSHPYNIAIITTIIGHNTSNNSDIIEDKNSNDKIKNNEAGIKGFSCPMSR